MYLIAFLTGIILGSLAILNYNLIWVSILAIIIVSFYFATENFNKAIYSLIGYAISAMLSNIYIFIFAIILLITAAVIDYYTSETI